MKLNSQIGNSKKNTFSHYKLKLNDQNDSPGENKLLKSERQLSSRINMVTKSKSNLKFDDRANSLRKLIRNHSRESQGNSYMRKSISQIKKLEEIEVNLSQFSTFLI